MRIAVVTPVFPPYHGGIGSVAYFNALELTKLGYQVEVFTPLYSAVKTEATGVKVTRVKPLFKYGNAAVVPALHFLLKDFNIIHLHYPFFGGAEVIWLYRRKLRKTGAKIVVHYHMDTVGKGLPRIFFNLSKKFFLPQVIKLADKVIITSTDYATNSDLAQYLKQNKQKFFELPNGVDTEKFFPQAKDQALLDKYQIKLSDKVVLFVGGLDQAHYFKGIDYLIEAFARLQNQSYQSRLVIVGQGELLSQYKSLAVQLGVDRKVTFAGYVDSKDLPKYYNLADVAVLPAIDKSEAFGLALVEAMACGKPVVASNLAGVRSVVDNSVNGYLTEAKNVTDLAAKINLVLSDSQLATSLGQAGRAKVAKQYNWTNIGQSLQSLYTTL